MAKSKSKPARPTDQAVEFLKAWFVAHGGKVFEVAIRDDGDAVIFGVAHDQRIVFMVHKDGQRLMAFPQLIPPDTVQEDAPVSVMEAITAFVHRSDDGDDGGGDDPTADITLPPLPEGVTTQK